MDKQEKTTKEKILSAAKTLFIESGFAGASIGKIAKTAVVNHSLIFHHFTNKENLWRAVKQEIVNRAHESGHIVPDTNLPLREFLRTMIINNVAFYQSHPELIRLLNWQRLESNKHMNIGISMSERMKKWVEAIEHYQLRGEISSSHKPEFIVTFLFSVISSFALDPNVFTCEQEGHEAYVEFCLTCFERAFAPQI